jgi:hypothetical protein
MDPRDVYSRVVLLPQADLDGTGLRVLAVHAVVVGNKKGVVVTAREKSRV